MFIFVFLDYIQYLQVSVVISLAVAVGCEMLHSRYRPGIGVVSPLQCRSEWIRQHLNYGVNHSSAVDHKAKFMKELCNPIIDPFPKGKLQK